MTLSGVTRRVSKHHMNPSVNPREPPRYQFIFGTAKWMNERMGYPESSCRGPHTTCNSMTLGEGKVESGVGHVQKTLEGPALREPGGSAVPIICLARHLGLPPVPATS
jgi:hypothetical protein